jgi:hypothetical protein
MYSKWKKMTDHSSSESPTKEAVTGGLSDITDTCQPEQTPSHFAISDVESTVEDHNQERDDSKATEDGGVGRVGADEIHGESLASSMEANQLE